MEEIFKAHVISFCRNMVYNVKAIYYNREIRKVKVVSVYVRCFVGSTENMAGLNNMNLSSLAPS
jgi:hypothetical protein